MAQKAGHQWFAFLNTSSVTLGKGDRSLIKGGIYNKKIQDYRTQRTGTTMIDPRYRAQVDLLLQAIPFVAKEKDFALKGGTAINLFVRDMPRLSVDIDLTYLPVPDRKTALDGGKICAAFDRQHPRDLFDVWLLLENEGYTEEIKYGFLESLLSHMRPMNEVIKSNLIDSVTTYATQFTTK